jgi:putative phosphoribosyl transferase
MPKMNEILNFSLDGMTIEGELAIPKNVIGLIIFSHGSGSSRFSPRNNFVAQHLQRRGLATFLFDLLTKEEDETYANRFNIDLLSKRLVQVTRLLTKIASVQNLPLGYFGASTGAASALAAAAILQTQIKAIVSRGGRPDLAQNDLHLVRAPTLLLVGELDQQVIMLNQEALKKIQAIKNLEIVKSATHLFEEPGTLEQVALLSGNWFIKYLASKTSTQYAKQ